MLDQEALGRLYMSYGFESVISEYPNISIFLYKKGRYFGVDIIPTSDDAKTNDLAEEIKNEYSKSGYAANIRDIKNNDDAELELFKSFFTYDSTIKRLKKKYFDFTNKQKLSLIGYDYKYVESPFELHNHTSDDKYIFEVIENKLSSNKPELIIIEAAAGYGKTCTAFEVLKRVVDKQINQLPIFTELSRNRGANIFRYILLDEIDLEFPTLNSNLVIKEIKNGRIPLIIDGFDELLEKVNVDAVTDNSFDDVESMLDTIGNLLEHKAKIILTTRKTAIFTGLEFESWLKKWTEKFDLTRIALKEPRIKDWLGDGRYSFVKEKNIPIQNLANPVLLTFLKNLPVEEFDCLIESPELLIAEYFDKMLTREMERQDLYMTVENQLILFKNVAKQLLEMDATVEDKEFFKLIILEDNKKLLEETKSLYPSINKRTIDNLVDTLSTHALLDRKGRDQNQIGFINDFVFGTFIGEIIVGLSESLNEKKYSSYMLELAVTAYRVQSITNKGHLWNKVQSVINKFNNETIFLFDIYLKEILARDYSEITIHDESFFNVKFGGYKISASVFLNCYFKNCTFDSKTFEGASFITCTFSNCNIINNDFLDKENGITAIKCIQEKCCILSQPNVPIYNNELEIVSEFEKQILNKLWSISHTKGHHISKLLGAFVHIPAKKVHQALKNLEERGYIEIRSIHIYFVINKINQIKQILSI